MSEIEILQAQYEGLRSYGQFLEKRVADFIHADTDKTKLIRHLAGSLTFDEFLQNLEHSIKDNPEVRERIAKIWQDQANLFRREWEKVTPPAQKEEV